MFNHSYVTISKNQIRSIHPAPHARHLQLILQLGFHTFKVCSQSKIVSTLVINYGYNH